MRMFVYGSLKRGHTNHDLLMRSRYFADGSTMPTFEMLDFGHYPGVIEDGTYSIRGEVFLVTGAVMGIVDALEGHPFFYRRVEVPVRTGKGVVPAWMYLYAGSREDGVPVRAIGRYKEWADPAFRQVPSQDGC